MNMVKINNAQRARIRNDGKYSGTCLLTSWPVSNLILINMLASSGLKATLGKHTPWGHRELVDFDLPLPPPIG